jgi:ketosteroid isomerase-like protein
MHANAALIERFYTAFANRDHATMAACYAPDATFEDEVFTLRGKEIAAMWHMLTATARDFSLTFNGVEANDATGKAHWEAKYIFSKTGRPVLNVIDATFTFKDGLIATHRDRFGFWTWSRQSLGLPGLLLGWSSFLQGKVRATAAEGLAKFISGRPEYR